MRNRFAFLVLTGLTACDLAPELPNVFPEVPEAFKEAPTPSFLLQGEEIGEWKVAQPAADQDKGKWWMIFDNEELNALEEQAMAANPSLKAASARLEQARAQARVEGAGLFPTIGADASLSRSESTTTGFSAGPTARIPAQNVYRAKGTIAYELDLFGEVRNRTLAAELLADAQDATTKNVMLLLQADVAQSYYNLRALDEEIRTLRAGLAIREESEQLMKKRVDAGMNSDLDYARTQTDLASIRAQLLAAQKQRANTEHMLATLLGKTPADFSFAEKPLVAEEQPPMIPAGLPSFLLERRPDVAAAQRNFAAANAGIGVANAAFFPAISLTGTGGVESTEFSNLFQWSSRTWSIGPSISIPIFQGNRNFANLDRVYAKYEEAVANYRAQVLVAFREVEDGLSDTRYLSEQHAAQTVATVSATRAAHLSDIRYEQGDLDYFEVIDARRAQLDAERASAQVRGARYAATIQLIRALGGGWDAVANVTPPEAKPVEAVIQNQ